jgi:hypothetical protein
LGEPAAGGNQFRRSAASGSVLCRCATPAAQAMLDLAMDKITRAFLTASLTAASLMIASVAGAKDCVNADPWLELGGIPEDFELTADPQDPNGSLIFVTNMESGAPTTSVVITRLDGLTGQVLLGSRTTIANNFKDATVRRGNGPDFVEKPTGELGVLYAGPFGDLGDFRSATPTMWNDFSLDVGGASLVGDPPPLPNTGEGEFPKGGMPLGQNTYAMKNGACAGNCYAALEFGAPTDVVAVAAAYGYTATASTQSPRDGYILFSAQSGSSAGLFEALIDHAGGFVHGSLIKLASLEQPIVGETLRAAPHPVTGSTVIFAGVQTASGQAIDVWEQPAGGGGLTLIGRVPGPYGDHYRAEASTTEVVLHYFVRGIIGDDSYTIPVTANTDKLVVGSSKKISGHGDNSEFVWLPAANRWALYYLASGTTLTRCWVTP